MTAPTASPPRPGEIRVIGRPAPPERSGAATPFRTRFGFPRGQQGGNGKVAVTATPQLVTVEVGTADVDKEPMRLTKGSILFRFRTRYGHFNPADP